MNIYPDTFEQPTRDSLTGLVTATYFRHLLREDLLPAAASEGAPLSVALFDIDSFVEINTARGHACGDAVLIAVSSIAEECLPSSSILVRYGGDEFAAALPDTRLDDAFTLFEEFRRRIAALRFDDWPDVGLTVSVGLATHPGNGDNDVELLRSVDAALYVAKSTGRNKVALPLTDSRMVTKTSHYTLTQLERLSALAKRVSRNEASLLREALDDVLKKYNDRLGAPVREEGG